MEGICPGFRTPARRPAGLASPGPGFTGPEAQATVASLHLGFSYRVNDMLFLLFPPVPHHAWARPSYLLEEPRALLTFVHSDCLGFGEVN